MNKPQQLREYLIRFNKSLAHNPDQLLVFADDGEIKINDGASLAFEYYYTLNLIITDWAHGINDLVVPILAWSYINQPPTISADNNNYKIAVDYLGGGASDVHIKIKLSERVLTSFDKDGFKIKFLNDACPVELSPDWLNAFRHLQ